MVVHTLTANIPSIKFNEVCFRWEFLRGCYATQVLENYIPLNNFYLLTFDNDFTGNALPDDNDTATHSTWVHMRGNKSIGRHLFGESRKKKKEAKPC